MKKLIKIAEYVLFVMFLVLIVFEKQNKQRLCGMLRKKNTHKYSIVQNLRHFD